MLRIKPPKYFLGPKWRALNQRNEVWRWEQNDIISLPPKISNVYTRLGNKWISSSKLFLNASEEIKPCSRWDYTGTCTGFWEQCQGMSLQVGNTWCPSGWSLSICQATGSRLLSRTPLETKQQHPYESSAGRYRSSSNQQLNPTKAHSGIRTPQVFKFLLHKGPASSKRFLGDI